MTNVILETRKSMVNDPGENWQLLLRTVVVVGLDELLLGTIEELLGGGAVLDPLKNENRATNQKIKFFFLPQRHWWYCQCLTQG